MINWIPIDQVKPGDLIIAIWYDKYIKALNITPPIELVRWPKDGWPFGVRRNKPTHFIYFPQLPEISSKLMGE